MSISRVVTMRWTVDIEAEVELDDGLEEAINFIDAARVMGCPIPTTRSKEDELAVDGLISYEENDSHADLSDVKVFMPWGEQLIIDF